MELTLSTGVERVRQAIECNEHCRGGLLASEVAFGCDKGPSGSQEILAVLSSDDRWSRRMWLGHVFYDWQTEHYVAGLFYCTRFINGCCEDVLFQRLYHWTVLDPKTGPAVSTQDGDCFAISKSFAAAVRSLCQMIASFDIEQREGKNERHTGKDNKYDARILDYYESWGEAEEFIPAFPIPAKSRYTNQKAHASPVSENSVAKLPVDNISIFPVSQRHQ